MPATIDQGLAAALQADSLSVTVAAGPAGRWPTQGRAVDALSPFATAAGAAAEAGRLATFLGQPLVRDRAVVSGEARALAGRCIRLIGDRLGYTDVGELVFVVGVQEQPNGTSVLTVLKRLA